MREGPAGPTGATGSAADGLVAVSTSGTLSFGGSDKVMVSATGGASGITLTFPTAVGTGGQILKILKVDTGVGALTINTASSQTINGTQFGTPLP